MPIGIKVCQIFHLVIVKHRGIFVVTLYRFLKPLFIESQFPCREVTLKSHPLRQVNSKNDFKNIGLIIRNRKKMHLVDLIDNSAFLSV